MSLIYRRIKVGKKYIEAISMKLASKNLIVLRADKGYIMCGYLDLKAAEKFRDVAVKIKGISTIKEALRANVFDCTSLARQSGIYKGQPIKEVLKLIT